MWTYSLFDYDPEGDGDEETWAAQLAAERWRTWDAGTGAWITLEGRRRRPWSLGGRCRITDATIVASSIGLLPMVKGSARVPKWAPQWPPNALGGTTMKRRCSS